MLVAQRVRKAAMRPRCTAGERSGEETGDLLRGTGDASRSAGLRSSAVGTGDRTNPGPLTLDIEMGTGALVIREAESRRAAIGRANRSSDRLRTAAPPPGTPHATIAWLFGHPIPHLREH